MRLDPRGPNSGILLTTPEAEADGGCPNERQCTPSSEIRPLCFPLLAS